MAIPTRDDSGKFPAYAWPGGYPLIYVCADSGVLCPACANGENGSEASEAREAPSDWRMVAVVIHWEGAPETCDHCGKSVEFAYGDLDDERAEGGDHAL